MHHKTTEIDDFLSELVKKAVSTTFFCITAPQASPRIQGKMQSGVS